VQACVKACVKACSEQLGAGSVRNVCEILARLLPGASSWWALRAGLVVGKAQELGQALNQAGGRPRRPHW
jgi:hypothetical protein